LFYFAYNGAEFCEDSSGDVQQATGATGNCPGGYSPYPEEGILLSDDEIQQAIADNRVDAFSMSWGEPETFAAEFCYVTGAGCSNGQVGLGQVEMASLAAEGVAVFVSTGDNGAWECYNYLTGLYTGQACASYPASDPNVVAVGGVNIPLDESGNLTGSITAWADNTTLGGDGSFSNNVGSGGGVSSIFSAPSWQAATLGNSMRYLPDMSLDADPDTGASILEYADYGGTPFAVGGTSQAAPEAAAMWGLVLQACKASATCNKGGSTGYRLGNPAPLLYAIYAKGNSLSGAYTPSGFTPQLGYSQVFYDVVYGSNQAVPSPVSTPNPTVTPLGYNSGPGYDQVTGIGAPFAGHLITAVTGTNVP